MTDYTDDPRFNVIRNALIAELNDSGIAIPGPISAAVVNRILTRLDAIAKDEK